MTPNSHLPHETPAGDERGPAAAAQPPAVSGLSAVELAGVMQRVADAAAAKLPLSAGMRALAAETRNRRLRRALHGLCDRLDAGEPPEQVFGSATETAPRRLRAVFQAGLQCGDLPGVLEQYLADMRSAADLQRRTWLCVAYPLILISFVAVFLWLGLEWVVIPFRGIFDGFDLQVPALTRAVFQASQFQQRFGAPVLLFVAAVLVALRLVRINRRGRFAVARIMDHIPIWGTLARDVGLASFSRVLALFVERGVPLPTALRTAGMSTNHLLLEHTAEQLAGCVEQGHSLAEAASHAAVMSPNLTHVFRWERQSGVFVPALRGAGDIFEHQARIQADLIRWIAQPLSVVIAAALIGLMVIALFAPMIYLLNGLS